MSWLKANIPWGNLEVDQVGDWIESFNYLPLIPDDIGNNAPPGPYYNADGQAWHNTGAISGHYDSYSNIPQQVSWSAPSVQTPPSPPILENIVRAGSEVTLTWTNPSDNQGTKIYYSTSPRFDRFYNYDGTGLSEGDSPITISNPSQTSITLHNLDNQGYFFALRSYNNHGESWFSNELSAPTTSGTLTHDETWSGSHTLTGDITIPSGITLTIMPGTHVYIPSGEKITVEGTLIAQGTVSEYIYFNMSGSSKWWGIKFEDSSNDNECILKYCTIQNASYGAYCYKSSPFIYKCTINNCTIGIYTAYGTMQHDIFDNEIANNWSGASLTNNCNIRFYNNDVHQNSFVNLNCYVNTYGPQINDNKIHACSSGNGMNLHYSNPYLLRNFVYDNDDYGIYCNESSPELDGDPGNNVVAYNGSYGIYINESSHPVLGGTSLETSQNSYYSNGTYDVYSLFASIIGANYCYWGGVTPRVYGNIWTLNQLSSDPNPDPHSLQKSTHFTQNDDNFEISGDLQFDKEARYHYDLGYELEQKEEYDAALEKYKFVVSNYPQTLEAELSLSRIAICYSKTKRSQDKLAYMETVAADYADFRIGGKASAYLSAQLVLDGEYEKALVNCSSQSQKFTQTDIAKDALFMQWQIYFDGLKDMKNAKVAMNQFENFFPDDYLFAIMKIAMGEWTTELEGRFIKNMSKQNSARNDLKADIEKPKAFSLFGNYPNPFNPETTIKYGLPEVSHVVFEVYNILGQKVKRLLDGEMQAGYHTVHWDGRNEIGQKVSAGLYFYHMRAGKFIKTQKMMLLP